jgi:GTP-binding protein EngB required for normal cell division
MMSQTEENIESTLIEDHSLWDRFKNFFVNDYSKLIDDREDQNEKVVRIAVIGKTRVGKGKFINAIRARKKTKKDESDPDEFEIQGPPANVTHGMKPGPLPIEKYGYPDNENPIIYFYDTGGFGDAFNENYNLEEKLKKYQKENKIKFDAIAFLVASNTNVKEEIQPLKEQETKVCLVFYIANKVDILKSEIGDEKKFQEEKGKIKGNILELLKKNEVINKHDFCKKNIYLISSKASIFENEDLIVTRW